jgi:hypothetical protein
MGCVLSSSILAFFDSQRRGSPTATVTTSICCRESGLGSHLLDFHWDACLPPAIRKKVNLPPPSCQTSDLPPTPASRFPFLSTPAQTTGGALQPEPAPEKEKKNKKFIAAARRGRGKTHVPTPPTPPPLPPLPPLSLTRHPGHALAATPTPPRCIIPLHSAPPPLRPLPPAAKKGETSADSHMEGEGEGKAGMQREQRGQREKRRKMKRHFLCDNSDDGFWLHAKNKPACLASARPPAQPLAPTRPTSPRQQAQTPPTPPSLSPSPLRTISTFTAADYPRNKMSKPMRQREGAGGELRVHPLWLWVRGKGARGGMRS